MKVNLEEIVKRFGFDAETAGLVQEEVEYFADWLRRYGPVTWFSGESVGEPELNSNLVWTPQDGDDDLLISNGYEESDYPNVLYEGYFLATHPCDHGPYSVFVTTGLWIDCNSCRDDEDTASCGLCCGNGYFLFNILDLFDEIQFAEDS